MSATQSSKLSNPKTGVIVMMSNTDAVSRRSNSIQTGYPSFPISMIEMLDNDRGLVSSMVRESLTLMLASLEYFRRQMKDQQKIVVRIGDRYLLNILEMKLMCISREEHREILAYMKVNAEDSFPLKGFDGDICRRGIQVLETKTERMSRRRVHNVFDDRRARQPHESHSQIVKNQRRRSGHKIKQQARYSNA